MIFDTDPAIEQGDLVEICSNIGNLVKTFEFFPHEVHLNKAHWIDTRQLGVVVEDRGGDSKYCRALVQEGVFWFDRRNLKVIRP